MSLPNNPKFERLLSSFTMIRPASTDGWREHIAVPDQQVNLDGRRMKLPQISFWYYEHDDLTLDGLLRKIVAALSAANHKVTLEIASAVVAIFACSNDNSVPFVERFNKLFSSIVTSDLNQFFLIRHLKNVPDYRFDVGSFSIGPFDSKRLAYQSKKAGSDFFERYEKSLEEMAFSVERRFQSVKVIHWERVVAYGYAWNPHTREFCNVAEQLIDYYYAQLSSLHFQRFLKGIHEAQEIPMALGSAWFALNALTDLPGSQRISVYLNIGGENFGFVCPYTSELTVNLGGGHKGVPYTESYLLEQFDFTELQECGIHKTLQTYCHFLALGEDHLREGRVAEGFLHFVIALDLLLGTEGSSTTSVSTRGAALAHRGVNRSYKEVLEELKLIYNARSKYVHEGRIPDSRMANAVKAVCREVAFCLLRLQRDVKNRTTSFGEQWTKDIDFLVAAIEAKRQVDADDWRRIGAWMEGDVRHSDFYAGLKNDATPASAS